MYLRWFFDRTLNTIIIYVHMDGCMYDDYLHYVSVTLDHLTRSIYEYL